jgi:hypothetical protein
VTTNYCGFNIKPLDRDLLAAAGARVLKRRCRRYAADGINELPIAAPTEMLDPLEEGTRRRNKETRETSTWTPTQTNR